MKRWALPLLVLLLALGAIAAVVWFRRPPPPPLPAAQAEEGDTGFSRQATEDRMRAIGYVQ
jgi:hypothetical protein